MLPDSSNHPGINPGDIIALNSLGLELQRERRLSEALQAFDKILLIAPNVAEVHYNRANVLGDLGRFDEAVTAYDAAIAFKPDFFSALNNRGWLLQKLSRYEEALASYERALAIKPDYANAKANRDALLRAQKQKTEAITTAAAAPPPTSKLVTPLGAVERKAAGTAKKTSATAKPAKDSRHKAKRPPPRHK